MGSTFGEVRNAATRGATEALAMSIRTLNIQIAVNVDGDDISGAAHAGPGTERSFHGWLGLMSAVDALVGSRNHPLTSPPGGDGVERTGAQR